AVKVLAENLKSLESKMQENVNILKEKLSGTISRIELESRLNDLHSRIYESIPRLEADLRSVEAKISRTVQKSELEQRLEEINKRLDLILTEIEALKGRVRDLEIPNI
ncbi:hypothetical protein KEJ51_03330, partial [Candidatus Bathyarchaeota archaeon]|nr:hypothetical protein [Candidatus Bathyarchaeota archaeon]